MISRKTPLNSTPPGEGVASRRVVLPLDADGGEIKQRAQHVQSASQVGATNRFLTAANTLRSLGDCKELFDSSADRRRRFTRDAPAAEGMTVADFLEQYYERYVVAESCRSIASIRSRLSR